MERPSQRLVKNVKFLCCIFALSFSQVVLSTEKHKIYAAGTSSTPLRNISSTQSTNWAGYEAVSQPGTFKKGQVNFTIPVLDPSTQGEVASWVGLGGDESVTNSAVLVQAGISSSINSSGRQVNIAWWEVVPGLLAQRIEFRKGLAPESRIYVYVESNINNNGLAKFYIKNLKTQEAHTVITNGQRVSMDGVDVTRRTSLPDDLQVISDGASGECIVERPTKGFTGMLHNLPKFKAQTITGCALSDGKHPTLLTAIGKHPNVSKIDLISENHFVGRGRISNFFVLLATPGDLDSAIGHTFTVTQPTEKVQVLKTTGRFIIFLRSSQKKAP